MFKCLYSHLIFESFHFLKIGDFSFYILVVLIMCTGLCDAIEDCYPDRHCHYCEYQLFCFHEVIIDTVDENGKYESSGNIFYSIEPRYGFNVQEWYFFEFLEPFCCFSDLEIIYHLKLEKHCLSIVIPDNGREENMRKSGNGPTSECELDEISERFILEKIDVSSGLKKWETSSNIKNPNNGSRYRFSDLEFFIDFFVEEKFTEFLECCGNDERKENCYCSASGREVVFYGLDKISDLKISFDKKKIHFSFLSYRYVERLQYRKQKTSSEHKKKNLFVRKTFERNDENQIDRDEDTETNEKIHEESLDCKAIIQFLWFFCNYSKKKSYC